MQVGVVYQQPGLVRRTAGMDADGGWAVVTVWDSDDEADAAGRASDVSPIAQAWGDAIDAATLTVRRFQSL
jgi:hypothetical protein